MRDSVYAHKNLWLTFRFGLCGIQRGSDIRVLKFLLAVVMTAAAVLLAENLVVLSFFPSLSRVNADFSSAYLRRELQGMAASSPRAIFLGDSVLWGFRLKPEQAAVSLLAARGCRCINLSFKGSSPPNYYALTKLLLRYGAKPRLVVLEIDQRVLNPMNGAYRTLHPAVAELVMPMMPLADRKALRLLPIGDNPARKIEQIAAVLLPLYAMRADIRETLDPPPEPAIVAHPNADMFVGEYDLSPLSDANVGVRYLEKTVDALRAARVPTLAFMTPTNHTLLHEYIDGPDYRNNLLFLKRLLERRGVRVMNFDEAFSAPDFYDYAHLRASAQVRLAALLEKELPR